MTPITFYLDPISPYAYLAFERLPQALEGCSYVVEYRPVLFAGLLKHWGQLGPAEIKPKRDWTYRHVAWLAHTHGIELQMPATHPFNPLPLLRLLLASSVDGIPNRYACERVLRHAWQGGAAPDDAQRLAALAQALQLKRDPQGEDVKAQLRRNTEEAIAKGVFGVPTFEVGEANQEQHFWGQDALEMLAARLRDDPWFRQHWAHAAQVVPGAQRKS